ncbi:MAG: malto-oligosyltrehalose synthase [Thermoplasmata archaeon]
MAAWVPGATYRLQLGRRFGFDQVRQLLPYLDRLGIDTVYLSPFLASRRGSVHGYDGIDPRRIDRERGGDAGFRRLSHALHRRGMGLLVDFVPNHLATSNENPAWRDVLAQGPHSRFAPLFDIDWSRSPDSRPAVVLPWLEGPPSTAFAEGRLAFGWDGSELGLRWGTTRLPVSATAARTWVRIMGRGRGKSPRLSRRDVRDLLRAVNRGENPRARALRNRLLSDQWYRLVPWWKVRSINYRRFFDVSDLVGVRPGESLGFEYLHGRLLAAVRAGQVQGIRVDHVDGIEDPSRYLRRLRHALRAAAYPPGGRTPYLLVEKILAWRELPPPDWPIDGTTGYEALNRITAALVPDDASVALDRAYERSCRRHPGAFAPTAYRAKRYVADHLFAGERAELVARIGRSSTQHRPRVSDRDLDRAVSALTAGLPVYRTYGRDGGLLPSDRPWVRASMRTVRQLDPAAASEVAFRWIVRGLLSSRPGRNRGAIGAFLPRWQQWSAAVAAKGIEDTAFYRYSRFLGANEVGGDPSRIGCSAGEFHAFMAERARRSHPGLTPTSTHDTKWGEDARARFVALAEWAEPWGVTAARWPGPDGRPGAGDKGGTAVDPDERYRLYQTWVATAAPGSVFSRNYLRRLEAHVQKSAREAKQRTSWLRPDRAHERRLTEMLRYHARDRRAALFRREMGDWVRRIAYFGSYYSLIQVALRTTLPGVPDIYGGSEGWNLSMVDPDNRRPVAFARLRRTLDRIDDRTRARGPPRSGMPAQPGPPTEAGKMFVTATLTRFRRAHRDLFDRGDYVPMLERRPGAGVPVLAFARRRRTEWLLVVAGRGLASVSKWNLEPPVGERWGERAIELPRGAPSCWRDLLNGRLVQAPPPARRPILSLADLFESFPLAVLFATPRDRSKRTVPVPANPRIRRP